MDNTLIEEILTNFVLALYSLPLIIFGMWLSTKSWYLYTIVVIGWLWSTFVIAQPIYEIWLNPDIGTSVKVMSWSILPIFFTCANIGTIVSTRAMKGKPNKGV